MTSRRLAMAFVLSLGLALFALVDFRRGFLFATYPVRTLFYVFNPWQVPMFAAGIVGMFVCHRAMRMREAREAGAARFLKPLTCAILALW